MKKCNRCNYVGVSWLQNGELEVYCPVCKTRQPDRFIEKFNERKLTYLEAVQLYDKYENQFIQHKADIIITWAELDVSLNESISRKIRAISAKDKLA
jgi:phage FluMu protein Com